MSYLTIKKTQCTNFIMQNFSRINLLRRDNSAVYTRPGLGARRRAGPSSVVVVQVDQSEKEKKNGRTEERKNRQAPEMLPAVVAWCPSSLSLSSSSVAVVVVIAFSFFGSGLFAAVVVHLVLWSFFRRFSSPSPRLSPTVLHVVAFFRFPLWCLVPVPVLRSSGPLILWCPFWCPFPALRTAGMNHAAGR